MDLKLAIQVITIVATGVWAVGRISGRLEALERRVEAVEETVLRILLRPQRVKDRSESA